MEGIQEIVLSYKSVDISRRYHVHDFGAACHCVLLQEKQDCYRWPGESQTSFLWRGYLGYFGYLHQDQGPNAAADQRSLGRTKKAFVNSNVLQSSRLY